MSLCQGWSARGSTRARQIGRLPLGGHRSDRRGDSSSAVFSNVALLRISPAGSGSARGMAAENISLSAILKAATYQAKNSWRLAAAKACTWR